MIAQQLVNGLMLGSVYALIGIGYALVFGVLRMLNLAHAYIFMVAPFIALVLIGELGMAPALALCLSLAASALLGLLLYVVAFKPIPQDRALGGFVTSLSFGVILQVIVTNRFGSLNKRFDVGLTLPDFQIGSVILSGVQLLSLGLSALLMVLLIVAIHHSRFGRNVRAIAENANAAALLGVRTEVSVLQVFAVSSFLAGLAGLLVAIRFESINPFISDTYALKGLAVIVIGGLGDIRGAMVAGLLIGIIEVLFQAYLPPGISEAFVWLALIAILVLKPDGLFGAPVKRREI